MKIIDILNQVANTSKGSEKEAILRTHKDNKVLQQVFFYTYNTFFTYGIKKVPTVSNFGSYNIEEQFVNIENILKLLSNREVTGNSAAQTVYNLLELFNRDSQDIIYRIINRDLKIGATDTIMNKLVPGLVPKFEVVLANKFDEKSAKIVNKNWFISHKLDGMRCIVFVNGDTKTCESFSRSGKPITTIKKLENELLEICKGEKFVFDGELCVLDENGDEDFQGIMKVAKKKDYTIDAPMYIMFDCLTFEEFQNGFSETKLSERYKRFGMFNGSQKFCKVLEQVPFTEESFEKMKKISIEKSWEGLMTRLDTTYKNGRVKDLLKYKLFSDAEYKVKRIEVGPFTRAVAGKGQETIECVTTIYIEHEGCEVGVGSGMSITERVLWKNDPSLIVGKIACVKYFEATKNQNGGVSLRFPTLKFVHGEERDT